MPVAQQGDADLLSGQALGNPFQILGKTFRILDLMSTGQLHDAGVPSSQVEPETLDFPPSTRPTFGSPYRFRAGRGLCSISSHHQNRAVFWRAFTASIRRIISALSGITVSRYATSAARLRVHGCGGYSSGFLSVHR